MNTLTTVHIVTGPSGSGKTTLCNGLAEEGWHFVRNVTTRPRRHIREHGHFVNDDGYDRLLSSDELIVPRTFGSWRYGLMAAEFFWSARSVVAIDLESAVELLNWLSFSGRAPECKVEVTRIAVPNHIRRKRLLDRGDDPEEIERRMADEDVIYRDRTLLNQLQPFTLISHEVVDRPL